MNYGQILSKAWKIIWKHKILWLFGVLAGCAASGSGGSGASGGAGGGSGSNFTVQPGTHDFITSSVQQGIEDFFGFLSSVPVWIWVVLAVGLFVVGFILSILFLMVGSLGQAGVIKGTGMADAAELDAPALSFGTIFNALKPHYWKVFLLQIGYRVAGFILTLILFVPLILLTICTCCLGLLLVIPIGWLINLLLDFTTIAIVEEELGIFEAIGRAWQVITRNLGPVIVMFLILGVGGLIVALIISAPLLIIPVPLMANLVLTGARSITVGLVITVLLSLVLIPVLIFLGGVLRAYILAAWTLTFRRLTLDRALEPTVLNEQFDEA
jgi:hypothetical protein